MYSIHLGLYILKNTLFYFLFSIQNKNTNKFCTEMPSVQQMMFSILAMLVLLPLSSAIVCHDNQLGECQVSNGFCVVCTPFACF